MGLHVDHQPIEHTRGRIIDCTCTYRQQGVFNSPFGARIAFLSHLVEAVSKEQGWDEEIRIVGEFHG